MPKNHRIQKDKDGVPRIVDYPHNDANNDWIKWRNKKQHRQDIRDALKQAETDES